MKKLFAKLGLAFTIMVVFAAPVFAAVTMDPSLHPDYAPVVVVTGGTTADYGNYFLQLIAGGLLYLAAPVTVLTIAIAGLRYVTSHGNQEAIDKAKKTLEFAVIGLLVIMTSYTIIRVTINTILLTNSSTPVPTATSTSSGVGPTGTGTGSGVGATGN